MTEEKKNSLFYKFLAWLFGITVLISMTVNFWQMIHNLHLPHLNPNPSITSTLTGIFCYFVATIICLVLISFGLTMVCVFFNWFFKKLVEKNLGWIKKEFGLVPDYPSKK